MTLDREDFAGILASAKMGLWMIVHNATTASLYVDDVCADLMGIRKEMTPEEAFFQWRSCLDPVDYEGIKEFHSTLMIGDPVEITYAYNHPTYGRLIVRCCGILDTSYDGKVICFRGCHQDVSNYHRMILEHEKKAEIADLVVEALGKDYLNVYLIYEKQHILEVVKQNGAFAVNAFDGKKITQFNYDKSWGQYADGFVYEEDIEYLKQAGSLERVTQELKTKQSYTGTFRVIRDAGIHYCQFKFARLNDEIIIASFRNIDSIIQKEQDHEYKLELSEMIVTALARDYVNVFVINTFRNILDIRKMDEPAIMGVTAGDVIKADYNTIWNEFVTNYVHPDDKQRLYKIGSFEVVSQELKKGQDYTFSYRSIRNGEHHFQSKYIRLSSNRIIAAFRNIDRIVESETKQRLELEELVRSAEKANKAKSEFLSNMSHDIRTPMNAIFGMTQIALQNIDDKDRVRDSLKKIELASDHLLALINDVLDMSKLESNNFKLHNVPVDLIELIDNCILLLEPMAESLGVKMILHKDQKPITRYVMASPLHFRQIILNLTSNGIKYNHNGGYIDLSSKEKQIDENHVEITFICKDNGQGMSKEFLSKLFDPFAQENSGSRTQYKGTGLGLSIVKGLTEAMHGSISVESEKEVGSTFTLVIPFEIDKQGAKRKNDADQVDGHSAFDLHGIKALVVEDNEINIEIAKCLLSAEGLDVSVAMDGRQALELVLAGNSYDIILMDIMMPIMDGYEATRQIRAAGYTLPILAMTANAFAEDRAKALAVGMDGHVTKPFRAQEIHDALMSVLGKKH